MKYFTKEELEDITNSLLENPSCETLNALNNKYNKENLLVNNISVNENEENVSIPNILESQIPNNSDFVINAPLTETTNSLPEVMQNNEQTLDINNSNASLLDNQLTSNTETITNIENNQQNINNMPSYNQGNDFVSIPSFENTMVNATNNNESISSIPVAFDSIVASGNNLEMQSNLNASVPSFEIPSNNQGMMPNNDSNPNVVPSFESTMVDQNNTPLPFDGNLWNPNATGAENMMEPTENFTNQIQADQNISNSLFANINMPNNNPKQDNQQYQQGPSMFGQLQQTYQ